MELGVFTVLFSKLSLEQMLEKVRSYGIRYIEVGSGGYPGKAHCDPDLLLSDLGRLAQFRKTLDSFGIRLSALACQGNPLHPSRELAQQYRQVFERTVELAERLEVSTINLLSGCPGDSEHARFPNWSCCAWPPDYPDLEQWQWNEVAIPYWGRASELAARHGVHQLAIEMHPGFLVYNPETALRLRAAVGESIGVNFDPSHLFWLGINMPTAIKKLGSAIFHCHAKDTYVDRRNVEENGFLDGKPYHNVAARSWTFRTVGWGHGLSTWREIVSALRLVGYDGVLSIEHEDPLADPEEGLTHAVEFLRRVMLVKKPGEMWWA